MKVIYLASNIYHLEDLLQEKIHGNPSLHLARLKDSALTSHYLSTPYKVLIESTLIKTFKHFFNFTF